MNLKNITLKTAELGPVSWENVEKIQPNENGFIVFVSSYNSIKKNIEDEDESILVGYYILTYFDHKPTYKEIINYIVQQEYPNGKEAQMLRIGIHNPQDEEYIAYYNNVEEISSEIKSILNITEA